MNSKSNSKATLMFNERDVVDTVRKSSIRSDWGSWKGNQWSKFEWAVVVVVVRVDTVVVDVADVDDGTNVDDVDHGPDV
ncbi:hypothetical protein LOK49_LG04G03357 [Camellia lanceoleosa]|uniref:Uncharacterized protein n=1 Tax=Camellia lanceoleosa TaxID=1840588 RepID=A0ACC0HYS7_9ERIC|nr:hypothetical protein LOK49_LG04G03357 [Camellia lanceoleosa]